MGAKTREHDQAMAQRMKDAGEERTSGRCCICYNMVPLSALYIHLTARCPGPRRKGARYIPGLR